MTTDTLRNPWDEAAGPETAPHTDVTPERKTRRSKRVHFMLIGVFTGFVAVVTIWSLVLDNKSEAVKEQQKKSAPASAVPVTAPSSAILDAKLRDQAEQADKDIRAANPQPPQQQQPGTRPGQVPPPVRVGQALPQVPLSAEDEQKIREAQNRERTLHTAVTSPILAIKGTGNQAVATATAAVKQSPANALLDSVLTARKAQDSKLADANARLAALTNGAGNGNGAAGSNPAMVPAAPTATRTGLGVDVTSAARSDQQWLDQQQAAAGGRQQQMSPARLEAPPSPYTLMQGAIIPAALLTALDSSLPGNVTAIVTQDIYDSIDSTHLLIPRGSKLWGVYNNQVKIGQARVMMAFTRLVLPGGASISLSGMQGTDSLGRSGVTGEVNNHFVQTFGSAFLIAGIDRLLNGKSQTTTSPYYTSSSGSQVLADTGKTMLERNRNVAPTVEIPYGERFNILVARDLDMSPVMARTSVREQL